MLLVGLAGKRYFYAKILADFHLHTKTRLIKNFFTKEILKSEEIVAAIEKDMLQLEQNYLEPSLIILSAIGFTSLSIVYALFSNFFLESLFILFYSIPALCSGIGSKKLNHYTTELAQTQKDFLTTMTDFVRGSRIIRQYQAGAFITYRASKSLQTTIQSQLHYEKQRTLNSIVINGIDLVCSISPILIGGLMTYQQKILPAQFIAIYLVSHNIGYQFQEISYFLNTYKSTASLRQQYAFLLEEDTDLPMEHPDKLFPITIENLDFSYGNQVIFRDFQLTIHKGEKIALIGKSGSGKTTLLDLIAGDKQPDKGRILFAGHKLSPEKRRSAIGYILQDNHYFPSLTLVENITLGKNHNCQAIPTLLSSLGLAEHSSQEHFSGGNANESTLAAAYSTTKTSS